MAGLKWGLLASGSIAHAFANGLEQTDSGVAYAVASRDEAKVKVFAQRYDIPKAYGNYQAMLDETISQSYPDKGDRSSG